jgi:DNA-binding FadR family transcriptional regulator
MASFKESKWRGIDVKPGQIVSTMNELSEKTMLSRQQLRTVMQRLLATGEITIQSTNRFSIITIENWALYQSDNNFPTNESTNTSTNEHQQ